MTPLPDHIRALFWEGLAVEPDPDEHEEYIAIRVLEAGDEADIRWLLGRYGPERMRSVVTSGRLRAREADFWRRVLVDA